ncbi:MAG: class I SAM-dependent methyltransferase [Planctomycetota bacterium]|nr:class I SAM-dependent methyltransferase [Planctomycetota bacterium]
MGGRDRDSTWMPAELAGLLACPRCRAPLRLLDGGDLACSAAACPSVPRRWPIVRGVPVILDEASSPFRIASRVAESEAPKPSRWRRLASALFNAKPRISRNVAAARNFRRMAEMLAAGGGGVGLVAGCGAGGQGIRYLTGAPGLRAVNTDIRLLEGVHVVADVHMLPFRDAVFDFAVAQAILEHVTDPWKAVGEIRRVLKPGGLLYSEVPLLQPVHGAPADFWRFTPYGHRLLWSGFAELAGGACCGPGMAFALAARGFLTSPFPRGIRRVAEYVCDWLLWWPKYLDGWLAGSPGGTESAGAYYFLGRKLPDGDEGDDGEASM